MAEQALVLAPAVAKSLVLWLLIATRNAARVTLGCLHALSALVELPLLRLFASVRHRRHFLPWGRRSLVAIRAGPSPGSTDPPKACRGPVKAP